jgi:hypothetical protein
MVLSADKVRRRISLSLRQLHGGGPVEGDEQPGTYEPPAYQIPGDVDDEDDNIVDEAAVEVAVPDVDVTPAPAAGPAAEADEPASGGDDDQSAATPSAGAVEEPSAVDD